MDMAKAEVSVSEDTKEVEPKTKVKVPGKLSEKATRGTLDKR